MVLICYLARQNDRKSMFDKVHHDLGRGGEQKLRAVLDLYRSEYLKVSIGSNESPFQVKYDWVQLLPHVSIQECN